MRYGSVPAVDGLSAVETGEGKYRTTVIKLDEVEVAVSDSAGVAGWAAKKVYDFEEGAFVLLGSYLDLTKIEVDGPGIEADFDGDVGVGTAAATAGATLATTEQDIIPTTATPQAVGGVTAVKQVPTGTELLKVWDGSGGAKDVYLNFAVDDADQDITGLGATNLKVSGEIHLHYLLLGDK
jgi:hypothetical protein